MEIITQPAILQSSCNEQSCCYELHIPQNLTYFEGHFEELPILPGVAQIKWAVDFAKNRFGKPASTNIANLKFMQPIFPSQNIHLTLTLTPAGHIDFRYYNNDCVFSQGLICYE